jgi:hypothetical protein
MATENTAPATPPADPTGYDTMSAAFDSLLTPDPTSTEPEGESTPKVEGAAPVSDTPADDAGGVTAAPPAGDSPAQPEASPPSEPPAGDVQTEEVDWKKRFEELEAKITATPDPEPAPAPAPAAPAEAPKVYSEDESEFLTTYEKEWPDVSRGEALKRRAEYQQVVQHVFAEIARVYGPLIERGASAAEVVADNATLAVVREAHPDYDDAMYADIQKWAEGLSGVKKKVAMATIAEGDPEDVVDLVNEYKVSTGRGKNPKVTVAAPTAPAAPAAPAVKKVTEISSKAKQAAQAMSVVESKRTTPIQPAADLDDFEGAWAEAVGSK